MIFYRIEGFITSQEVIDRYSNGMGRRATYQENRLITIKTEEFNSKLSCGSIFVSEVCNEMLTLGVVIEKKKNIEKIQENFCKEIGIDISDITYEEITIMDFKRMAERADHSGFLRDSDEFLEEYHLDRLSPRGFRGSEFGENILETLGSRKKITHIAEKLLIADSFLPELNRIYKGKRIPQASGNPCQYIIRTDDTDKRNIMYRLLLSALYENGRIEQKRYSYIDLRAGMPISNSLCETLYRCSDGGCIVVRVCEINPEEDDDYASGETQILEMIAKYIKKYHNSVLTIVCLERECTKIKETLYSHLGNIGIIEIEEELVNGDRARDYLKLLAKENHVDTNEELLAEVEDDKTYLSNDLKEIFDKWLVSFLKTSVYPQYKECISAKQELAKQEPKGTAYEELSELIGLEDAKAVLTKALNFYKVKKIYGDRISMNTPCLHMCFLGNPGTCKTSCGRLFARILFENGILSKGHLVEVTKSDLTGKYVGWTSKIVKEKFDAAEGGLLLIDEAYALVEDRANSFGDEAIHQICEELEVRRDRCIVIFAGYPDKMEEFLNRNPGLRSRIAFNVVFKDYSTEELLRISKLMCDKQGQRLTDSAEKKLTSILEEARKFPDAGQGRLCRNIIESALMNKAGRILEMNVEDVTDNDLSLLTAEDIEAPVLRYEAKQIKSIGFCA